MRAGNVLELATLRADRSEHIKDAEEDRLINVTEQVSPIEEDQTEGTIVEPDRSFSNNVSKKLTRPIYIRSMVQGITDDLYQDGERIATIEFCRVPAGTCGMGRFGNFHRVTISKAFYLGKYPVTQDQWEAVMGDNPSHFKGAQLPVEQVSWEDCQRFIERLNCQPGKAKYRLPTEAEWEYACRAGSITTYPFGDDKKRLTDYGWYHANSGGKSHPVGQKTPNSWGLHDMNGGVWEWCNDWYAPYPRWKQTDPKGPSSGSERVLRGGSWFDGPKRCRSGFRSYFSPDFRCNFFGFRLARRA